MKYQAIVSGAIAIAPMLAIAEVIDFEAMEPNAPPRTWTLTMTDGGQPPRWQILDDATSPAKPKVLAQLSEDRASGRFPLAIYPGEVIRNGYIEVRFKPVSGRVDQAAGLVWRYRDENNYYIVRANALEDNVVLYKVENGKRTDLPVKGEGRTYGKKAEVPAGQWSTLRVVANGRLFEVSFNGNKLYDVEDATFSQSGKVGVWTKADSVTQFDDLTVVTK